MDQQQSGQPVQVAQMPTKQNDFTKWIIIILLIVASAGTGIAYLVFTKNDVKQQPVNVLQSPSPTPSENAVSNTTGTIANLKAWKKYENIEHNYSFVYFARWTLAQAPDNVDFVLKHVSKTDPGTIEGRFIPTAGRAKSYCEQNRTDEDRCTISRVTANREIFIDLANSLESGKISMLIVHPTEGAIAIDVTDANFDTNILITQITSTLQFADEQRTDKLQFCPTSWSEDRAIGIYQGISFDAKDFDKQCK